MAFERVSSGLEATGMAFEQVANGSTTDGIAFELILKGRGALGLEFVIRAKRVITNWPFVEVYCNSSQN